MSGVRGWSEFGGLCGGLLLMACPIPDRDVQVITEEVNNAPVRLIEPVGLSRAQRCECDPNAKGCDPDEPEEKFEAECPLPDVVGIPPYLDPSDPEYRFCKCDNNEEDKGALYPVEFFAEDQDKAADADEPEDKLFAAILLNMPPDGNPADYLAYEVRYRSPTEKLPSVVGDGYKPPGRPAPYVRRIFVGDPERLRWDLCNGDPDVKLGFNTFTVLVTDREWNEVTIKKDPANGITEDSTSQQIGVVDIAGGATYDMRSYTFYCSSADDPTNPINPGGMGNDPFGCVERCYDPESGG